jgi:hypothetical protein
VASNYEMLPTVERHYDLWLHVYLNTSPIVTVTNNTRDTGDVIGQCIRIDLPPDVVAMGRKAPFQKRRTFLGTKELARTPRIAGEQASDSCSEKWWRSARS